MINNETINSVYNNENMNIFYVLYKEDKTQICIPDMFKDFNSFVDFMRKKYGHKFTFSIAAIPNNIEIRGYLPIEYIYCIVDFNEGIFMITKNDKYCFNEENEIKR